MSIVDREGLGPLHHACSLDVLKMAKRNYNFNDLTEEERNEAKKECLALKVRILWVFSYLWHSWKWLNF